jgi:hypothetical protein
MGPIECFEVMRSLEGDNAAMKIMHPLDLSVRVYGGFVRASRDDHFERKEREEKAGVQREKKHTFVHGTSPTLKNLS